MSEIKSGPAGPGKVGNTKRPSTSKHWCFTLNNHTKDCLTGILNIFGPMVPKVSYVFQEEKGENGTPHLQGYINFKKRVRPMQLFKNKRIHWEKCRSPKHSIAYCSDPDKRHGNIYSQGVLIPQKIKVLDPVRFYHWQKSLLSKLQEEPDDRTIRWLWDRDGNVGKSAFAKYLCVKENAIILSGKGADIKYGIISFTDKLGAPPRIVLIDIPRTNLQYLSYTAIEEVKNGCFFSSKYESAQFIMNSPHVVCFANEPPMTEKMSKDRWKITEIKRLVY